MEKPLKVKELIARLREHNPEAYVFYSDSEYGYSVVKGTYKLVGFAAKEASEDFPEFLPFEGVELL